jgi:hypothetical protein
MHALEGRGLEREQIYVGRFRSAPLYDMLPMRWRPDTSSGETSLLPFEPDAADLASEARPLAADYWRQVAESPPFSRRFRKLAGEQARRCGGVGKSVPEWRRTSACAPQPVRAELVEAFP